MKKLTITLLLCITSTAAWAQSLTSAQKDSDFRYLASLFATYYAPYQWKLQLLGVDTLNIKPWLDRVAATRTDLDFYEVCVEYVASLNDTHDHFSLPSDFIARLPVTVDVYDDKVLIETITRSVLPASTYPFAVGDELVSIDGTDIEQLLQDNAKYAAYENPISTRRLAATRVISRVQSLQPHAPDIGDTAQVGILRQNGNLETYTIPWQKTGTPLEVGPVPSPSRAAAARARKASVMTGDTPDYLRFLDEFTYAGVDASEMGVQGYGSRNPVFAAGMGPTFTRRLGSATADFYYSGTFKYEELTLGYIRIPNYAPASLSLQ